MWTIFVHAFFVGNCHWCVQWYWLKFCQCGPSSYMHSLWGMVAGACNGTGLSSVNVDHLRTCILCGEWSLVRAMVLA